MLINYNTHGRRDGGVSVPVPQKQSCKIYLYFFLQHFLFNTRVEIPHVIENIARCLSVSHGKFDDEIQRGGSSRSGEKYIPRQKTRPLINVV